MAMASSVSSVAASSTAASDILEGETGFPATSQESFRVGMCIFMQEYLPLVCANIAYEPGLGRGAVV
jgi:hypothetical protein